MKPFLVYGSQLAALVGFSLFALTFVLSARLKLLEDFFGGLDKMYHVHHTMAKAALILLLAHPVLLALRWIPEDTVKTLWYLFPVHRRLEINLGSWAIWGLVILMLLTLVIKLPYDKWKTTHKFMGIFFILSIAHIFYLEPAFSDNPALKSYVWMLSIAGISGWVYKTLLYGLVTKKSHYLVTRIERLSDRTMEIELSPENKEIKYNPGQFYFFSFLSPGISRETHPFTICNKTEEGKIHIMVKSLGDYTHRLYEILGPGVTALLEGPYGRFDYREGIPEQIWIGGGVGIAPFLSWANELIRNPQPHLTVDAYYCVNTSKEATHIHVFHALQQRMPTFRIHLACVDVQGYFKASKIPEIEEKEIYICGPKAMRKVLLSELGKLKILKRNIHFEDFDF